MNNNYDESLVIGRVVEVDGTHIIAELDSKIDELSKIYQGDIYQIGQFGSIVKIYFGRKIIYAHVSRLRMRNEYEKEVFKDTSPNSISSERIIEADLFGEGEWNENQDLEFERGVSTYPLPQQKVYLTTKQELNFIFGKVTASNLIIGHHVSSKATPASIHINELLNKHSAVLGSTGSGKSGTVSAIIHGILSYGKEKQIKDWYPNIIILDPHNEYGSAFSEDQYNKLSTEQNNLKLPYWLFNLQETVNLFIGKTEFVATSQANIIKKALLSARNQAKDQLSITKDITVDSPVPYKIDSLRNFIDNDKNSLTRSKQESHLKILEKIDILRDDSRYNFMMNNWTNSEDDFYKIVDNIVSGNKPIKIIDLSGIPNEVASIVSSVIARMIFMIKIWQKSNERKKSPILFICEEAHRYIPSKGEAMYESAQEAIRRIAKEGRKYGIGIMLVSQRPSELEPTVMSQCNSWIVLRTTNENDTSHIKSMLPDSLSSLTKVLSSLRQREAIVIGQATTIPSRILINQLRDDQLPRSNDIKFDKGWQNKSLTKEDIENIRDRWRFQKFES